MKDILKNFSQTSFIEKLLNLFTETRSDIRDVTKAVEKNTEVSKEVIGTVNATANDQLDHIFATTKVVDTFRKAYELKSDALSLDIKNLQVNLEKMNVLMTLKFSHLDDFFKRIEGKVDAIGTDVAELKNCTSDEQRIKQITHIVLEAVKEELRKEQVVAVEATTTETIKVSTE